MPREQTIKKHAAINKRIEELKAEKYRNRPKFRIDVIFEMVAEQYFLTPETISNIYYKPKK